MTYQMLALIQQPAPISNCFFGIKKKIQALGTFVADVNFKIKILGTVLNKIFLVFLIFYGIILFKDEKFEDETLSSKSTLKFKDFTMPKCTRSGFFLSIRFCIKRILTTTDYCNL